MEKDIKKELATVSKYTSLTSIYFLVGYPIQTIVAFVIAKKAGSENLGLIALYLSFLQILSFIALLGTNRGSIKYVAKFLGLRQYRNIKKTAFYSIAVPITAVVLMLLIFFLFRDDLLIILFPKTPFLHEILKYGILLLPVLVLKEVIIGLLRGLQRPQFDKIQQVIIYPLSRIAAFYLLLMFFGITKSLLLATVISVMVSVIFLLIKLVKEIALIPQNTYDNYSQIELKEYLTFSLPLILVPVINIAVSSVDVLFLSKYIEANEIGVYTIVKRFGLLVSIPISLASPMIASTVSKMFGQSKMKEFTPIYSFITKWGVLVSSVVFTIIYLQGDYLLGILGDDYSAGLIPLRIFAGSQWLITLIGPVGNVLIMSDKKNKFLIYSYISITVGFFGIIILTPILGLTGAILSISFLYCSVNLLCLRSLIRELKIYPMSFRLLISRSILLILTVIIIESLRMIVGTDVGIQWFIETIIILSTYLLYYFKIEPFSEEDIFIYEKFKIRAGI